MNTHIKIALLVIIVLVVLVVAFCLVQIIIANSKLEVTSYKINTEFPEGFKIAQISDFHNSKMAENNAKLLSVLKETQPDIIVITGDLIDSGSTNVTVALDFVAELVAIAPCYYVSGNHESRVSEYADLTIGINELGVTVLEDSKATITWQGHTLTLIGVSDPGFKAEYLSDAEEGVMRDALDTLVCDDDGFTVLLSHRPEFFEMYAEYGIDLVFSGHAHGGQIRLPNIGGIYAPGQGFFPEYDAGVFTLDGTTMIVSRGVGKSIFPIRYNNSPELVLVEFTTGEE